MVYTHIIVIHMQLIPSPSGMGNGPKYFWSFRHTAYAVLSRLEFEFFRNENSDERTALKSVRVGLPWGIFSNIGNVSHFLHRRLHFLPFCREEKVTQHM